MIYKKPYSIYQNGKKIGELGLHSAPRGLYCYIPYYTVLKEPYSQCPRPFKLGVNIKLISDEGNKLIYEVILEADNIHWTQRKAFKKWLKKEMHNVTYT